MAAAALLEGTVAAVVLEPRLLLHTLVLLLSLEDWARHALANLIAVKHGMSRLFDSGERASPLGPPDSLPFGPCLFSIWSYVQFPTQSWMNEGIVSLINQAEEKPVVQALLFVVSPVLSTVVLVCSLASTLAYLALWPLSSSLAIIRAALAIIRAALGLHHEPAAGGEHVPVEAGGSLEVQPLPPATEPPPAAAAARPTRQRRRCAACGVAGGKGVKLRTCARCRQIRYCGPACQAADWARHRSECSGGAEQEILNMARA
ncbi:hypothetical protein ABPG77_005478 [Micractinium sp. CCAP 211/92]